MPTKKSVISLPLDDAMLKRIDEYRRHCESIPTRTEAIRRLIDESLIKYEKKRGQDK